IGPQYQPFFTIRPISSIKLNFFDIKWFLFKSLPSLSASVDVSFETQDNDCKSSADEFATNTSLPSLCCPSADGLVSSPKSSFRSISLVLQLNSSSGSWLRCPKCRSFGTTSEI